VFIETKNDRGGGDNWTTAAINVQTPVISLTVCANKKLSWCWQIGETRLEVSQGHQAWYH